MKIDKFLWSRILFHYKDLIDEWEISEPINNIIKLAKLEEYNYLEKEYPYSDIVWEVSEKLSEINLNDNKELDNVFFDHWKNLTQEEKQYKYAQNEYKIFTKEFKDYFVDRMIKNPSFEDLYFFRKNLSQEDLRVGLNNFFDSCKFNNFKNQSEGKIDYWENVDKNKKERFTSKDRSHLLELLELANLEDKDLNKFNKIGFLNDVMQVKFNKLLKQEVKNKFIEIEDKEVYLIDIKINALILLNDNENLNTKNINDINEKVYKLFSKTINLEKISKSNDYQRLKMLSYSKANYEENIIKVKAINNWLDENKNEFLIYIDTLNEEYKKSRMFSWEEEIKKLGEKIILESRLDNNLKKENKIKEKKNKI